MKRYHFLEGLSCYWKGMQIMKETKVKKMQKPHTPFGSRKTAIDAFDKLFRKFRDCKIVLSYSTNGYPDRGILEDLLRRYKKKLPRMNGLTDITSEHIVALEPSV